MLLAGHLPEYVTKRADAVSRAERKSMAREPKAKPTRQLALPFIEPAPLKVHAPRSSTPERTRPEPLRPVVLPSGCWIEGCVEKAHAVGFCRMHWLRLPRALRNEIVLTRKRGSRSFREHLQCARDMLAPPTERVGILQSG